MHGQSPLRICSILLPTILLLVSAETAYSAEGQVSRPVTRKTTQSRTVAATPRAQSPRTARPPENSSLVSERYTSQPAEVVPQRITSPQRAVRRASAEVPVARENSPPAGNARRVQFEAEEEVIYEGSSAGDTGDFVSDDFDPMYRGNPYFFPSVYGRVEGLLWWTNGDHVPPLVTTSPVGTPVGQAGALNNANTTILFGNDELADTLRGGAQYTLGLSLGPCVQIEGSYFSLGELTDTFARTSLETPILARPFLNIVNGIDDHQRVAFEGVEGLVNGSVNIEHTSRFQGANALGRVTVAQFGGGCGGAKLQLTGGYRYLSLEEALSINTTSTTVRDPAQVLVAGTVINVSESFRTESTFNGGEFGLAAQFEGPNVGLDLFGRVAIGNTHEVVTIAGSTTTTVPGGGATTRGQGLLAQPTNIGTYTRDELTFVPHLGADLRFRLNPCWQFTVGYDFLFWSDVVRPGEQIDTAINTTQFNGGTLVGARRPAFQFNDGYLWAHGISLGLDCRF